ncbi:hypothetical protein [Pseudohongiella sp. O18]|uniref:hypothetical protein n=1 Tax=Pseudohongiella sp. O18 TaxID=2904248 RepID=UPI001F2BF2DF|nr:hypothetical protein [Pseudohongiella sp. O18]
MGKRTDNPSAGIFWQDSGVTINRAAFEAKSKEVEHRYESPVIEDAPATAPAPEVALQLPPGKAGEIAQVIYHSAPRPVWEVAIVSALGLLAGVCGRSWLTPTGSGLNVYVVLLARSGIGKETMAEGISLFVKGANRWESNVGTFYDFSDYASGQALIGAISRSPCFTHIASEFGRKLKRMSNPKDSALQELRTVMTKLYAKSGPQSVAGGITYSDEKNNKPILGGAAYSLIGDSTPGTFHQALTDDMMEDGFMSRLTVIEYNGERPRANKNRLTSIPEQSGQWFAGLATQARTLRERDEYQAVDSDAAAWDMLDAFDIECDDAINATDDEARRQMWNRAHLKALRVASLLAVADNHLHPVMTTLHATWAIDLVRRDIAVFTRRLESGDVGEGDQVRESKILTIMKDYLKKPPAIGYKTSEELRVRGIIERSYLQKRTASLPAFSGHPLRATKALDQTLQSLCLSGYIMKCKKEKMFDDFKEHGECYRIMKIP